MPTPFVHSAVGYAAYCASTSMKRSVGVARMGVFVLLANLPDLDFIPGFLVGNPTGFHHYATHSILAALLSAAVMAGVLGKRSVLPLVLVALSHPVLDLLTWDQYGWYEHHHGIPLFWPVSGQEIWPWLHVFSAPYVGSDWSKLLSSRNFETVFVDVALSLAVAVAAWFVRSRSIKRVFRGEFIVN